MILTRIEPERNMARYYQIEIEPDLFGGVVLVRRWGRIGTMGLTRRDWYRERPEAAAVGELWHRAKRRRGYRESA